MAMPKYLHIAKIHLHFSYVITSYHIILLIRVLCVAYRVVLDDIDSDSFDWRDFGAVTAVQDQGT